MWLNNANNMQSTTTQPWWHLTECFNRATLPISPSTKQAHSSIILHSQDFICAQQHLFSPRVDRLTTCSPCSSSRCSSHLYTLNVNICGILIGLRIEFYEMSIIAPYWEMHSSALEVQSTLRWICYLRHLGMFLMVSCQVAWKNPGCPVLMFFFCIPSS